MNFKFCFEVRKYLMDSEIILSCLYLFIIGVFDFFCSFVLLKTFQFLLLWKISEIQDFLFSKKNLVWDDKKQNINFTDVTKNVYKDLEL